MAKARVTKLPEPGPDGEPRFRVTLPSGEVRDGLTRAEVDALRAKPKTPEAAMPPTDAPPSKPVEAPQLFAYDLDAGLLTANEYRERKGLPALARFGEKLVPEVVAENAEAFARAAAARSGKGAPDATPAPGRPPDRLDPAPAPPVDYAPRFDAIEKSIAALVPSGDVGADMDRIRAFYADKPGLKAGRFAVPRLREEDTAEAMPG